MVKSEDSDAAKRLMRMNLEVSGEITVLECGIRTERLILHIYQVTSQAVKGTFVI